MIDKNFKIIVIVLLVLLNIVFSGIFLKMNTTPVEKSKNEIEPVEQLAEDNTQNSINNTNSTPADSKSPTTISKGASIEQIKQDAQVIHQLMLQARQNADESEVSKNEARADAEETEMSKTHARSDAYEIETMKNKIK
jgi:regulatory protein YycI of two-component signal transduction system YycFG